MPSTPQSSTNTESMHARWTVDTLAVHHAALRECDLAFQHERDRRYHELAVEREKALKIKETADLAALELAREIQTYKDEKANQLREQLGKERLEYASKGDLKAATEKIEETLKPIIEFIASQRGQNRGTDNVWKYIFAAATFVFGILGAIGFILNSMKD